MSITITLVQATALPTLDIYPFQPSPENPKATHDRLNIQDVLPSQFPGICDTGGRGAACPCPLSCLLCH